MFRRFRLVPTLSTKNLRTFKNFGHKPEPVPNFTVLWHGFLTFSFIACGLNWEKFRTWLQEFDHNPEEVHQTPNIDK